MADISAVGTSVRISATNTFPVGFDITQFADDSDPLDLPELTIAETAMGLNGTLVSWSTANPILMTLNVIAGAEDDRVLNALFEANRVGRGKQSAQDVINALVVYPGGDIATLVIGVCTGFIPGKSISSDKRLKSRPYAFAFENRVGSL